MTTELTGNEYIILRALENGVSILNTFAHHTQFSVNKPSGEQWQQKYNRQMHELNGMQEMALHFGYKVTFDFDEKQGFFAEVTHINIMFVNDGGEVLSKYRHLIRR